MIISFNDSPPVEFNIDIGSDVSVIFDTTNRKLVRMASVQPAAKYLTGRNCTQTWSDPDAEAAQCKLETCGVSFAITHSNRAALRPHREEGISSHVGLRTV